MFLSPTCLPVSPRPLQAKKLTNHNTDSLLRERLICGIILFLPADGILLFLVLEMLLHIVGRDGRQHDGEDDKEKKNSTGDDERDGIAGSLIRNHQNQSGHQQPRGGQKEEGQDHTIDLGCLLGHRGYR
jgi:hypothetical protein